MCPTCVDFIDCQLNKRAYLWLRCSFHELNITSPVYWESLDSKLIQDDYSRRKQALRLSKIFLCRREKDDYDYVHDFDTDSVDLHVQKHVEKWVEKIGLHFLRYTLLPRPSLKGGKIPTGLPYKNSGVPPERLTQKVFSGDVSGSIGEGLFALLMISHYNVVPDFITHLRAAKSPGPSPDFYFRRIPDLLRQQIFDLSGKSVSGPLICECKGSTSLQQRNLSAKLAKAMIQVESLRPASCHALIALFSLDALRRTYQSFLTVICP